MRRFSLFLAVFFLTTAIGWSGPASAQEPVVIGGTSSPSTLLPPFINGWEKQESSVRRFTDPAASAKNSDLLKEAGFTDGENATYVRQGRAFNVKAYRFADTTGAFAAYSAMRAPGMAEEKLCNGAASLNTRILIQCTNVVLDVEYDKVTAMTPAEMRSLVSQLPKASGTAALPPTTPLYLPKDVRKDMRLALGPAGLAHAGTPLSAAVIDFAKSPEVAVGHFESLDGAAVLTLIKYPTFALATERLKALEEFGKGLPKPAPDEPQLSTFYTHRVGPIVAVISGNITAQDARLLAEKIPYDVEITRNEPGYSPKDNIGNLIVNILYLSFIIIAFTFVTGLAFGGFRILSRKYFPGRFVDRPEDAEFIKLDLRE